MSSEREVVVERLMEASVDVVADINALIPQLKPSWSSLTADDLTRLLCSESRVYVARAGTHIIGLTVMVPHRHLPGLRYHVEDVVVASDHRRIGIASRLLDVAMKDAPGQVLSFDPRSHASRPGAHRLYSRLGFVASNTTVFRRPANEVSSDPPDGT